MNTNSWKKIFYIIYTGQAFSIIGSSAVQFSIIFYLSMRTGSATVLGIAAIMGFLPGAILGSFAGVYIDRNRKKTVMMLADGFIALSSLVLVAAFMLGEPSIWLIFAILFARGVGTVFHGISMQAAIPLFVPLTELVKAGGWAQMINGAGNLIGPFLGAILIAHLDMQYVVMVDVVGAILAILCLLCVNLNDPKKEYTVAEKADFKQEFKLGIVALRKNKPLYKTLPHYVATGFLYMPINALFMLLVIEHYMGTEDAASAMEVAVGLGMIVGSFIIGKFAKMKYKLMVQAIDTAILGGFAVVIGALPPHLLPLAIGITFVWGITVPFFSVPFGAYAQESIPPEELGRVTSLIYTLCYIGNPLGIAVASPIADVIGVDVLFVILGVLLIINGMLCFVRVKSSEIEYVQNKMPISE